MIPNEISGCWQNASGIAGVLRMAIDDLPAGDRSDSQPEHEGRDDHRHGHQVDAKR